jgi:antitoxin component YwqK of YwqJK toxin-antitoxin module
MKKILFVLLLTIPFIGCNEKRVKFDELYSKGEYENKRWYYNSKIYTGQVYNTYSNGRLKNEFNMKDGFLDGNYKLYWERSDYLKYDRNYKNGKKHGIERKYFKRNGHLQTETNYKNGIEHGLNTGYFNSGKVCSQQKFENGKRESFNCFNENGTIRDCYN